MQPLSINRPNYTMTTQERKERTEAIADAIIQTLADPRASKVHDHMRALLDLAETVEEMQGIGGRNRFLSDTCADVADEVIETHVDDMETEASELASQILSTLSTIELNRGLVKEGEPAPWA